jgi:hypothetical protein
MPKAISYIAKRDTTPDDNSIGTDATQSIGVADSFLSLRAQHDFIYPLTQLIQDGLKLLETSTGPLMSKENVERFQLTLTDAASITEEVILVAESDDNPLKMHVVKTFVAEVESIIVEAVQALGPLKENECVKDHLDSVGSASSAVLLDCENRLRRKFEDLKSALLSETPQRAPEVAYLCCRGGGGLETFRKDHSNNTNDENMGKHT